MSMSLLYLVAALGSIAAVAVIIYHATSAVCWTVGKLFKGVGAVLGHSGGFLRREAVDGVQTVGALLSSAAIAPLAAGNLAIGRRAPARHYGRALRDELGSSGRGLYRLTLANPLRFLGMGKAVDHLETHMPEVAHAGLGHSPTVRNMVEPPPLTGRLRRRAPVQRPIAVPAVDLGPAAAGAFAQGMGNPGDPAEDEFEGYRVLSELPPGGSGARLFVARPLRETADRLTAAGAEAVDQVVIKSFAISAGSTLPQIVREGRALEAARKVGFVLQHSLDEERFWYVMPYVRGRELGDVSTALHVRCGAEGLDNASLTKIAGYAKDVLDSLGQFHEEGLWHKDVKPSNIIVADESAILVDLGLVTPLSSAMTLTTHGTEFYRDPELVRQALRGAKVNEIDGVKFDLYAMGGVLYSMVENSFPAHGNLSRLSKRCPEALAFIIRRAMADLEDRYANADEMCADLEIFRDARDPFAVLPAELPSFRKAMQGGAQESIQDRRSRHEARAGVGSQSLQDAIRDARAKRSQARSSKSRVAKPSPRPAKRASIDSAPRRRKRSHMALTSVVLLAASLFSVAVLIPAIRQANHVHSAVAEVPSPWNPSVGASTTYTNRSSAQSSELPGELDPGEALLAQASRELAAEELVQEQWRAELLPLFEHEGSAGLPEWSRGAQVLVLTNVLDLDALPPLAPLASLLESSGYGVIGSALNRSETPMDLELEAQARHSLGLSNTHSEKALTNLQTFIDATPELDAILWLAQDENGTRAGSRLVLPSSAPKWLRKTPRLLQEDANSTIRELGENPYLYKIF